MMNSRESGAWLPDCLPSRAYSPSLPRGLMGLADSAGDLLTQPRPDVGEAMPFDSIELRQEQCLGERLARIQELAEGLAGHGV